MDLIKINTFYTYEDEFIFITRKTKKCIGYIKGMFYRDSEDYVIDDVENNLLNKLIMDDYGFYLNYKCKELEETEKIYIIGQSVNAVSWEINNDLEKYKILFK